MAARVERQAQGLKPDPATRSGRDFGDWLALVWCALLLTVLPQLHLAFVVALIVALVLRFDLPLAHRADEQEHGDPTSDAAPHADRATH